MKFAGAVKVNRGVKNPVSAEQHERVGSIRIPILQEDAYLIERVNAGMGEWEYVIQYCGEYYATAPTENIARDIVERAQWIKHQPPASPDNAEEILKDIDWVAEQLKKSDEESLAEVLTNCTKELRQSQQEREQG